MATPLATHALTMSRVHQGEPIALLTIARSSLLVTLSYAAWRFGATDTTALIHVAYGLAFVLGLSALAWACFRWRPTMPSAAVFLLPMLFIVYSILQLVPLPGLLANSITVATEVHAKYGEQPAGELDIAAKRLGVDRFEPIGLAFTSVIPQHSKAALIPILLATVVGWLTSLLFTTQKSRRRLLWCILLQAVALALWGIVQRSTGSGDLLPGVPNQTHGIPFASFIYRNAGAAALLPGVAAAVALFTLSTSRPIGLSSSSRSVNRHYSHSRDFLTVRELILISLGCVLVVGVIASLSRGAWLAGGLALLVPLAALRKSIRAGKGMALLAIFVAILAVATTQITHQLEARLKHVSLHDVAADGRWDHWRVGLATAISYFPCGSGLGTYGYVTLPHQTSPSSAWFREAHNQYLETITESGLAGILILLAAIFWMAKCGVSLLSQPRSLDDKAYGIFGLMVLVCAGVQSMTDFVISIPANLLLYGCFMGFIASVVNERSAVRVAVPRSNWTLAVFAMTAILLAHCIQYSRAERVGDDAIERTSLIELDEPISPTALTERLEILDNAIALQPDRATLYRHLAMHHFAQYRQLIIKEGKAVGESIAWQNTQPESIHAILFALPPDSRDATIKSLVSTTAMRESLGLVLQDLAKGLRCNPLFSQLHFTAAATSPVIGADATGWLDRCLTLSKSDADKLYANGLLAYFGNQVDQMKSSWQDCLQVSNKHDARIFSMSLEKLSLKELAFDMIPPSKPNMIVSLVRVYLSIDDHRDAGVLVDRRQQASAIAQAIESGQVAVVAQHATAASIYELAENRESAAMQWLAAVDAEPLNVGYRLRAAEGLRSIGKLNESLEQIALGRVLATDDQPFDQLASRVRKELANPNGTR